MRRPRAEYARQVGGRRAASPDRRFGPEEYGIASRDPNDQPAMPDLDLDERNVALASLAPESRLARDERKAGIVIESLPCPLLIATGAADANWPRSAYDGLWLQADYIEVEAASHWGLVLNHRALGTLAPRIVSWMEPFRLRTGRGTT